MITEEQWITGKVDTGSPHLIIPVSAVFFKVEGLVEQSLLVPYFRTAFAYFLSLCPISVIFATF